MVEKFFFFGVLYQEMEKMNDFVVITFLKVNESDENVRLMWQRFPYLELFLYFSK